MIVVYSWYCKFFANIKICIPYMCFTDLADVLDGSSDVQWFMSKDNIYLSY